jgi:hypothetical protein
MKVVINTCYGGYGLSTRANAQYWMDTGKFRSDYEIERDDPALVSIVEKMGKKAWGDNAELKVVEIPDGIEWELSEYDGVETIHEKHRSWS